MLKSLVNRLLEPMSNCFIYKKPLLSSCITVMIWQGFVRTHIQYYCSSFVSKIPSPSTRIATVRIAAKTKTSVKLKGSPAILVKTYDTTELTNTDQNKTIKNRIYCTSFNITLLL